MLARESAEQKESSEERHKQNPSPNLNPSPSPSPSPSPNPNQERHKKKQRKLQRTVLLKNLMNGRHPESAEFEAHLLELLSGARSRGDRREMVGRWWGDGGEMVGRWWGDGGEMVGRSCRVRGARTCPALRRCAALGGRRQGAVRDLPRARPLPARTPHPAALVPWLPGGRYRGDTGEM